ncbi:outer membrane lipid asymmetry maintenance protein MlaD [Candidatus Paracaedibacter symbiosus]|uniref:outer membrane lipid asymmetry maintenance protein MlaD n=1 Tax=Candidatus Paracaedibacter symbiosus TaxID=244582 RepID=UPI000509BAD2|nr:outer membrane lipid asymmetry maintenance protein MlaD [Candidatus Paracaedibacter symbiosus]
MKSNVVEAIMGAIVLAVAGIFLSIAYRASSTVSEKGVMLHAKFDRIDGLVVGNDVKISGVKVGKIFNIKIEPSTFLAVVSFTVSSNLRIPTDSSAEIVSESFMGGKYIALVPGGAEESLQNGDAVIHTQSALSFEALIGKYLFSSSNAKSDPK